MITGQRVAQFNKMPKVDLHLHLDGSVKPATALELAPEAGIKLPSCELAEIERRMRAPERCDNLADYLSAFQFVGQLLHTAGALERVAYEVVEQAAGQNCKYIEVRFAPQLHTARGLSAEEAIARVLTGLARGERAFGVKARCIAICMRHHPDALNLETVEAAAAFAGKGVVAVDLAGDEAGYPAHLFGNVFALARRRGLPVTIHAGEATGPDNIRAAVEQLGAVRIGHGVRLREDPALVRELRDRNIPLEMCPISNIQTKASPGWDVYPIREYYNNGLKVTVNTDNLTVSATNLAKEYETLAAHCGFTVPDVCRIIMYGVEAAFLPEPEKRKLARSIEAEFAALNLQF